MKRLLTLCCFVPYLLVQAQIQIELVEEPEVEIPDAIEAPVAADHGSPGESGPVSDILHFLNKDRLSGRLIQIDSSNGMLWKHPDAKSDTVYGLENLKMVALQTPTGNLEELMKLPRIELTNGDQYRGRIVRMDGKKLVIDSPLTGQIDLRSDMVRSIRPIAGSTAIYSGPNSLEEWEQNRSGDRQWEFKNNALYGNNHNQIAGIELEKLTDKASVDFSVEWRGNLNFQIGFWGQDLKNVSQNCYTLNMQSSYVRGYRNYDKIGRNDLGNAQVQEVMQDGKVDVRLLLNREAKEILVLFDGKLVTRWNDTFEGKIVGNALIFGSMSNTPLKLTRIVVREWDGDFELDASEKPQEMDQLITANGDVFTGRLEKIDRDVLYFKNDFAVFQVPLDRVMEISFSKDTRAEPRLQAGDVELFLPGKERLTLKLSELDRNTFTGSSEVTGEITVKRKYLAEVKLNPYDDRHQQEEDGW